MEAAILQSHPVIQKSDIQKWRKLFEFLFGTQVINKKKSLSLKDSFKGGIFHVWMRSYIVSYPDQKQLLKKKPELIAKKKV